MLIEDLVTYIEDNTDLVVDTDLFIGALETKSPRKCVLVSEFAGGMELWSGMKTLPIMVQSQDVTYLLSEALVFTVYDLLNNKAGFSGSGLSDILFCEVLNRPFPIGRSAASSFIFSSNFLLRMK